MGQINSYSSFQISVSYTVRYDAHCPLSALHLGIPIVPFRSRTERRGARFPPATALPYSPKRLHRPGSVCARRSTVNGHRTSDHPKAFSTRVTCGLRQQAQVHSRRSSRCAGHERSPWNPWSPAWVSPLQNCDARSQPPLELFDILDGGESPQPGPAAHLWLDGRGTAPSGTEDHRLRRRCQNRLPR